MTTKVNNLVMIPTLALLTEIVLLIKIPLFFADREGAIPRIVIAQRPLIEESNG